MCPQNLVQIFRVLGIADELAPHPIQTPHQFLGQADSRLIRIRRNDDRLDARQGFPVVQDVLELVITVGVNVIGAFRHFNEPALRISGRRRSVRHRDNERVSGGHQRQRVHLALCNHKAMGAIQNAKVFQNVPVPEKLLAALLLPEAFTGGAILGVLLLAIFPIWENQNVPAFIRLNASADALRGVKPHTCRHLHADAATFQPFQVFCADRHRTSRLYNHNYGT